MPGPAELLQHQSAGLPADAAVALLPGAQKEVVISWFVCEPVKDMIYYSLLIVTIVTLT